MVEYLQTLPVWADLRDMAVAVHFVGHSEGRWSPWPIFNGFCPIKLSNDYHSFFNNQLEESKCENARSSKLC